MVANSTATLALELRSKPRRVNKKAITAVANTSKNPSTHRCTTHQRQYSTIDTCVCSPHTSHAPEKKPIHTVAANNNETMDLDSPPWRIAGHRARPTNVSQIPRPA